MNTRKALHSNNKDSVSIKWVLDILNSSVKQIISILVTTLLLFLILSNLAILPAWITNDLGQSSIQKTVDLIKKKLGSDQVIDSIYRVNTDFSDNLIVLIRPKHLKQITDQLNSQEDYAIKIFSKSERTAVQELLRLDNWQEVFSTNNIPFNSDPDQERDYDYHKEIGTKINSISECKQSQPINKLSYSGLNADKNIVCVINKTQTDINLFFCGYGFGQVPGANRLLDTGIVGCSVINIGYGQVSLNRPNLNPQWIGGGDEIMLKDWYKLICISYFECEDEYLAEVIENISISENAFSIGSTKELLKMIANYNLNNNFFIFLNRPVIYVNQNNQMMVFLGGLNKSFATHDSNDVYTINYIIYDFVDRNYISDRYTNDIRTCTKTYQENNTRGDSCKASIDNFLNSNTSLNVELISDS